jgi:hypothetical protein
MEMKNFMRSTPDFEMRADQVLTSLVSKNGCLLAKTVEFESMHLLSSISHRGTTGRGGGEGRPLGVT